MNTSHLNRHKRIHVDEKPPTCDVCNKSFTKRTSLTVHKRIHKSTKPAKPSAKSKPGANARLPRLSATAVPTDLSLHKRTRTNAKSNAATPSAADSPPSSVNAENQIQAGARSTTMAIPPPPGLLLNPHLMAAYAGMFPLVRYPMLDVSSALLRLPGLNTLAQMRDAAK